MELNDEVLCAYLDGELAPEQRAACESALAADPGARQRLARLRHADEQLRAAFPLAGNPSEDPLVALILGDEPGEALAPPPPAAPRRRWYREPRLLMALAAGVGSLALGLALLGRTPQPAVADPLTAALDRTASGLQASAAGRNTRPVLSFKAADGRYCRVFEQDGAGAAATEGLACRDPNGWTVLATAAGSTAGEDLRPAGGSAEIDALMSRLGGGEALDATQEQVLIACHWRAAPR